MSVDIAVPQPCAEGFPALNARKIAIGTSIPPTPANSGTAKRRRSRSSPMSNSRRASSPTTKKKNVISPELTQPRRSIEMPWLPRWTDSSVPQSDAYEDASTLTQTSAATAAPSSTAALPVSVRRNSRSGVSRFRPQAVRPEKGSAAGASAVTTSLTVRRGSTRPRC